jgi:tetratricopeptide (TPR) repeat protein
MPKEDATGSFTRLTEPILRKFIENIESPFVWTPLGLFVLSILAFPVTQFDPLLYLAVAFLLLTLGADWVGRLQNRRVPPLPAPDQPDYQPQVVRALAAVQAKAVHLLAQGKIQAARALTARNLRDVREALQSRPDDAELHVVLGYVLKDAYQSSKGTLPQPQRLAYLKEARRSFEHALSLSPHDAAAHNGMGNVLFFEGQFDAAIAEHEQALALTDGNYPDAAHDKRLVQRVQSGDIPFAR